MEQNNIIDFVIPLDKEGLLKGEDQYCVTLLDYEDCRDALSDFRKCIDISGCASVLENFDSAYSLMYDSQKPSFNELHNLFEEIIDPLIQNLRQYVLSFLCVDASARKRIMNIVKMSFYLVLMFIKTYEEKLYLKNEKILTKPKRTGRHKGGEEGWDWLSRKENILCLTYSFLSIPFETIWGKFVPFENSFISLLGSICYKSLESADINAAKCQTLRTSAAQVLGLLIICHNHGLAFVSKAVQMLSVNEEFASTLGKVTSVILETKVTVEADGHNNGANDDNDIAEESRPKKESPNTLIPKILQDILCAIRDDQSSSISRPAAAFISELVSSNALLLVPSLSLLAKYLNIDCYQVRNAVLTAFSEILPKYCFETELNEERKFLRDKMLGVLLSHVHDENAFVRSKSVQIWSTLAKNLCIPRDIYVKVLVKVGSVLKDKSTYVSKNAIQFFVQALEYNPYAGRFNIAEIEQELDKERQILKQLLIAKPKSAEEVWKELEVMLIIKISDILVKEAESQIESNEFLVVSSAVVQIAKLIKEEQFSDAINLLKTCEKLYPDSLELRCNVPTDDKVFYYTCALKKIFFQAAQSNPEDIVPEYYANFLKILQQYEKIQYLEECQKFTSAVLDGQKIIKELLMGSGTAECLAAIEFMSVSKKFNLAGSDESVAFMLLLLRSHKPEIKTAVITAYQELYLETNKTTPVAKAQQVITRLIKLVRSLDTSRYILLSDLIQQWWRSCELSGDFVQVLLDKVIQRSDDLIPALILLKIIVSVNKSVVAGNLEVLKELLISTKHPKCIEIVNELLAYKGADKVDGKSVRYLSDNLILKTSADLLLDKFCNLKMKGFYNMSTSIINVIFKLCFKPEELANSIMFSAYQKIINFNRAQEGFECNQLLLSRLVFLSGEITLRKFMYCETDVFNVLKKCKGGVAVENKGSEGNDENEIEADNVVAADDALYVEICICCDKIMADENASLAAHMRSLTVRVLKGTGMRNIIPELKMASSLSLGKYMLASHSFCEDNIALLATLMGKSDIPEVRSNLVFAFGDLLCQFPNIAEPYVSHLYSRLGDSVTTVRRSTVTVLCDLILQEMIKVRGSISELVLRIEESDITISERVKSLLIGLAQRGNSLYNVVPDIISNLSSEERNNGPLSPTVFKSVISFVLEQISKEKQSEKLIERLISRLMECSSDHQSNLLAFCLTKLSFSSEKSLRRLTEGLPKLRERLLLSETNLDCIKGIITTGLKSSKPAVKEAAKEAHEKLEELLNKDDDEDIEKNEDDDEEIEENEDDKIKKTKKEVKKEEEDAELSEDS